MTESWWYAQDGATYGPLSAARVRNMFMAGELTGQDWLWEPGMSAWERAGALPAFAQTVLDSRSPFSLRDSGPVPSALPSTDQPRRAGPWSRFFAQMLDIYLVRAVLTVLVALAGYRLEQDGTRFLGFGLMLPVGLMVQALLLFTIGTTPGKALLGLRVRRWDGGRAALRTLVRRQGLLWPKGLAIGLPLINLVTLHQGKQRLDGAQLTSWDEAAGTDVYQDEHRPGRLLLCVVLIVIVEITGQVLADTAGYRFSVWHLP